MLPIINLVEVFVVESRKEAKDDVHPKESIHDYEGNLPLVGIIADKSDAIRNQHARVQQQGSYEDIPVFFDDVVLVYQTKFLLLLLVCFFELQILFGN